MLLEIVLPLEGLSADLAGEGHVVLMAALVDHEVVGLREAPLAVLADELYRALGAHLLPPAELPAVPLCLHRHYREHPYKFPPLLLLVESLSLLSLCPPLSLSLVLFLSLSPANARSHSHHFFRLPLSPFSISSLFSLSFFLSLSFFASPADFRMYLSFSLYPSLLTVVLRLALLLPRKASLGHG